MTPKCDNEMMPVCRMSTQIILMSVEEYFRSADLHAVPIERDEFNRLICPACGTCYGQEWPGV